MKLIGKINLIRQSQVLFGSALLAFLIIAVTITQIFLGYSYSGKLEEKETEVLQAVNGLAISVQEAGEFSDRAVLEAYARLTVQFDSRIAEIARRTGLSRPSFQTVQEKEFFRDTVRQFAGELRSEGSQIRSRILIASAVLLIVTFLVILFNLIYSLYWIRNQKTAFRDIHRGLSVVDSLMHNDHVEAGQLEFSRIQELSRFFYQVNQISRNILYDRRLMDMNIHGNLNMVLESLFSSLTGFIQCDRVALAFITSNGMITAETAYTTYSNIFLNPGFSEKLENTSLKSLTENRQPRVIEDLPLYAEGRKTSTSTALLLKEKIKSSITLPLFFNDNCVGFLFIATRADKPYTMKEAQDALRVVNILKQKLYIEFILQETISETCRAFVSLMSEKDNETSLHIQRMSNYSFILAKAYSEKVEQQSPRFLRELLWFAPLHDIGKIGTPDAILQKPGRLTPPRLNTRAI